MKYARAKTQTINMHLILIISIFVLITSLYLLIFNCIQAESFYSGFPYGSYYGLKNPIYASPTKNIYGTAGPTGLPIGSMFSPYGSSFGLGSLGGLYGAYGGLYGGLYGLRSLGLRGLYGGLYGAYGGLYGSLYGLGSLGLGGLYGGLYGAYGGLYGGLYGLGSLGLGGGLYGLGALTNPLFFAAQVGTWTGTWTNFVTSGLMTLNLAEDPITGALYGYAQLLGNFYLDALVSVDGTVLNNQIIVDGSGTGLGNQNFTVELIGTLLTASTMTGVYNMINNSSGGTITEQGTFSLELVAPVI